MRRAFIGLAVLWLGTAGVAFADPITLISGGMAFRGQTLTDTGFGTFDVSGSGFTAFGAGFGGAPFLHGVTPGIVNPTSGSASISATYNGSVTAAGQTLDGEASMDFQFVTLDPILVSASPQGTSGGWSTRFTGSGLIQLWAPYHLGLLFSQEVNGTGTLSFGGRSIGPGGYLTQSAGLSFEPPTAPSPTPEPASMVLLGTGLAAACQSRRLRRANGHAALPRS